LHFIENAYVKRVRPRHHEVFDRFRRWSGNVPAGVEVDFLGSRMRTDFFSLLKPQPHERHESPPYPEFDEEYLEWIDLLEAASLAAGRFTMLELGAGFGRWSVRGAFAARQQNLPYSLVAVEAEPTHFAWLMQNFIDNQVDLSACKLVQAAVAAKDGCVGFQVGDPLHSYGQSLGGETQVDAVSLPNLLSSFDLVDLIDMDVQGAELEILVSSTAQLNQKVKRIHVETHGAELYASIYQLFRELDWKPHFLFEGDTADVTPWGRMNFQGGTQSWLNPPLHKAPQIRDLPTWRNSFKWQGFRAGRKAVNRIAPIGTARRNLLRRSFSKLLTQYERDPDDVARRG
jgi:FkbM family methyltransferase